MCHLQTFAAEPCLTEALHKPADSKAGLLILREMEETQAQETGLILDGYEQTAAPAVAEFHIDDLPADEGFLLGTQALQRHDPGSILIAQRQVHQQIHRAQDTQPGEFFFQAWTDALEGVNGLVGISDRHRVRP